MSNPTYDYTWNNDRRWAKNREPTENFLCPGISLNNNFDYKWDEQENTNPCSGKRVNIFDHAYCGAKEPFFKKTYLDMYMGTEPNSAIEIQSLLEATKLMNGNFYNDVIMT